MLTDRQDRLLSFIEKWISEKRSAPSYDEMMAGVGLSSKSNIHTLVKRLEERGAIRRIPNRARAIEVVRKPESALAEFRNALCILRSIDLSELEAVGIHSQSLKNAKEFGFGPSSNWERFRSDPYTWLLRASDEDAARVWSIIEKRSKRT